MRHVPDTSRRRRRSQGGNAFIEMTLGFVPYFALLWGIMDFSLAVFIYSTLQNAAREGVRYAITYNTTYNGTTYGTQTDAIKAVVQSYSVGFLSGTTGASYINVNYYLPNNLSTPATQAGLPQTVNNVYIQYLNQTGNVVEVQIAGVPWSWMAGLDPKSQGTGVGFNKRASLTLNTSASDVLEGYPVGSLTPPSP